MTPADRERPHFSRQFAMPNSHTFELAPVAVLLKRYVNGGIVVDPFAGNSKWGTLTNDLDPTTSAIYHWPAEAFVALMDEQHGYKPFADIVLFDPPYSPRQISECYKSLRWEVTREDTQNAALYKRVKDQLSDILLPGGRAICCGWNSMGFGLTRGFEMEEILLVTHGAAHNDTIVTVEIRP